MKRNDKVVGSFGTAIVTDVGYGFILGTETEPDGPVDTLVRIMQYRKGKPVFKYVESSEIKAVVE